MSDYGEQLAVDAEAEYVETQFLPVCDNCNRHSSLLTEEDDRFSGLCPECHLDRCIQAAHDDHIEHLIDKGREDW